MTFELFDLYAMLATEQEGKKDVNEVETGSYLLHSTARAKRRERKNSTTADHLYRGLDH